jgi:hypothetical protein
MSDILVWIVAIAFYAPFHFLGPLLVSLLTGNESQSQRKQLIINILIDCTLSMVVAFALAIWLFDNNIQIAMLVLIVSMFVPYLHIVLLRKYRTA